MSIANIIVPNNYHIYSENINDTTNRVNDIWLDNINGQPYNPSPAPIPTLLSNKFLRTTNNVSPTMFWGDVNAAELVHGTSNQILHTNLAGTASEWTTNLTVPGAFTSVGNGVFEQDLAVQNELNVTNDLQVINGDVNITLGNLNVDTGDTIIQKLDVNDQLTFNNVAGTNGQIIVSDGSGIPSWQNLVVPANSITAGADYTVLTSAGGSALWITPSVVNQIKYGTTFLAQNINAAAGPTALQFSTSTFINSAISNVGVPVNITQPSATEFTIGTSSVYNIDITGYVRLTPDGLGNPVVTLSLEVAGTEKTDYCIVCSDNYSFSGRFPAVFITASQNIRVLARRVVGTAALTTFANGLPAPSFASSILISTV